MYVVQDLKKGFNHTDKDGHVVWELLEDAEPALAVGHIRLVVRLDSGRDGYRFPKHGEEITGDYIKRRRRSTEVRG